MAYEPESTTATNVHLFSEGGGEAAASGRMAEAVEARVEVYAMGCGWNTTR